MTFPEFGQKAHFPDFFLTGKGLLKFPGFPGPRPSGNPAQRADTGEAVQRHPSLQNLPSVPESISAQQFESHSSCQKHNGISHNFIRANEASCLLLQTEP